ncbi:nuclear transport factor 2 family protein, partial [Amycolatopsis sp. NPDC059020]|uniref:nuclear transport factor 2 family protein n=1 Tax=Amycolatopsis sp. NPDC059020 TaxID=3346703 RepID=UPI00366A88C1
MSETARIVAEKLFALLGDGDTQGAAALFADDVEWDIPGNTEVVPWIGRRRTRAEVLEFFTTLDRDYLDRDKFVAERFFGDESRAVALGSLRSTVRATGKVIESAFALDLGVNPDGLITRYVFLEDSWRGGGGGARGGARAGGQRGSLSGARGGVAGGWA